MLINQFYTTFMAFNTVQPEQINKKLILQHLQNLAITQFDQKCSYDVFPLNCAELEIMRYFSSKGKVGVGGER